MGGGRHALDHSVEVSSDVGSPDGAHLHESEEHAHTVGELARDELERLVQEDDGEGDLQHRDPLFQVERRDLEHGLHERQATETRVSQ